jgi:hypothetical protein
VSVRITTYESTLVNSEKYIGWTFIKQRSWSQSWIQRNLETNAATILQFFAGLPGTLAVTFEEGTWSAWLYDLLHSRVDKLVVMLPIRGLNQDHTHDLKGLFKGAATMAGVRAWVTFVTGGTRRHE